MPSEYTTRNLQYRPSPTIGLHRAYVNGNRSKFVAGSLYAMEPALHEWLLDSPLRTSDPKQAHLFWVPIYAASLYMWPIMHFADEPYIGRAQREQKRRSHQGALLMKKALAYIRTAFPFWNATGGRDHVWLMLHDEGPCFAPKYSTCGRSRPGRHPRVSNSCVLWSSCTCVNPQMQSSVDRMSARCAFSSARAAFGAGQPLSSVDAFTTR